MATRMQQRRGTAAQWTSADPILEAGEIGFEIDTNKFKIGDGVNHWADLIYYASAADLAALVDNAPELLNTLNELAAALGDDPDFISSVGNDIANAITISQDYTDNSISTLNNALMGEVTTQISNHNSDTTGVHGIANTAVLATNSSVDSAISTAVSDHNNDTTGIHGIDDTSALATKTYANNAVSTHSAVTANVHGISDTANLVYQSDLSDHATDTTNIHGIANTAVLATNSSVDSAISTHSAIEVNVHGIANTQLIATKSYADSAASGAVSTHNSVTANVHGIADTSKLVTKDAATQTIAGSLTITGNLTVSGNTLTVGANSLVVNDPMIYMGDNNNSNSLDLGFVSAFNDGTYQHSGLVRDASDNAWKLFKGVVDEPTTTVNFAQGSLDDLKVNNLTAAGVVFTDGTQTKEGVPSRTPIISKTANYTLTNLSERDSLIEVDSTSPVTITIPTNSAVAFPVGTTLDILGVNTGLITIAGDTGVTVNATPGLKLRTQWSSCTLFKRATNSWVVYGDLKA